MTSRIKLKNIERLPVASMSKYESRKQRIHRLYKSYKTGLIGEKDLTPEEKRILVDWFGVELSA